MIVSTSNARCFSLLHQSFMLETLGLVRWRSGIGIGYRLAVRIPLIAHRAKGERFLNNLSSHTVYSAECTGVQETVQKG